MSREKRRKKGKTSESLRDELLSNLSPEGADTKREVPVMTRLGKDLVEMLDILVKLDIFASRSEAVAAIVEGTLLSQHDKFKLLKAQIEDLEKIQETSKEIAQELFKANG
jgi:Arc/MetJ-type ribon-helix-helix transcriptional regulator